MSPTQALMLAKRRPCTQVRGKPAGSVGSGWCDELGGFVEILGKIGMRYEKQAQMGPSIKQRSGRNLAGQWAVRRAVPAGVGAAAERPSGYANRDRHPPHLPHSLLACTAHRLLKSRRAATRAAAVFRGAGISQLTAELQVQLKPFNGQCTLGDIMKWGPRGSAQKACAVRGKRMSEQLHASKIDRLGVFASLLRITSCHCLYTGQLHHDPPCSPPAGCGGVPGR